MPVVLHRAASQEWKNQPVRPEDLARETFKLRFAVRCIAKPGHGTASQRREKGPVRPEGLARESFKLTLQYGVLQNRVVGQICSTPYCKSESVGRFAVRCTAQWSQWSDLQYGVLQIRVCGQICSTAYCKIHDAKEGKTTIRADLASRTKAL